MNLFEAVKHSVSTRDAAEMYGIEVKRNGMACCPFHNDRTPSMKIDQRYHCFGCGADGDSINFTAKLFDLSQKEAAEKLAADFGLSYDEKPITPKAYRKILQRRKAVQEAKEQEEALFHLLVSYFHDLNEWEVTYSPSSPDEPLHPRFAEAITQKDHIEYLLDLLISGSDEDKKALLSENQSLIANLKRRRNIPMAEKQTNKERLREITDSIEQGIKDLFQSDKYRQYLSVMSRFHRYSVNNTMLIYLQKPDATLVAGYNKWQNQFERHVRKGEHGITIIAPTPFKKKIEEQKLDPDTKAPMLDKDGKIITEEKEIEIPMFRPVKVFDLSQTDGKPLPQLASSLSGNVQDFEIFMEALKRSAPVPLEFEAMSKDTDGYFSPADQRIAIRTGMSEVQTVSAAVHEITHSKLHNYQKNGDADHKKDRHTEEVEAESVSYAVCQYYGIQTGENSFGYIAGWSQGKELPELKASLETINKTAGELIGDIDRHYQEICKERSMAPQEQAVSDAADPAKDDSRWRCYIIPDIMTWNSPALRNQKEAAEQLIGRIDYLGSNGEVGESVEYRDAQKFEKDLISNTDYGVPMSVVLYQNNAGEVIPHDFIFELDPPPKGLAIIDNPAVGKVPTERTPIEFYDTYTEAVARFKELRIQDYNRDEIINPQSDLPYARLTFGIQRENPPSAADLLHVRGGRNYLVDDFTRMTALHTSPEVMEVLRNMNNDLGFDRINRNEKDEQGQYLAPVDMPFGSWENSYFPPAPDVKLTLIDDRIYLYIQSSDEGYDYTLYDAVNKVELDGGMLTDQEISMASAQREICLIHGLSDRNAVNADLSIAEELRAAEKSTYAVRSENPSKDDTSSLPEIPEQKLDTYPMPDSAMMENALEKCGYLDGDLLPLSREQAYELMEHDLTVYMIQSGENPEMAFDSSDLDTHDGIFAVSREEWEQSPEFHDQVMARQEHQQEREQAFMRYPADSFAIYQVKRDDPENIRFMNMDWLKGNGLTVSHDNYDLVYTAPLTSSGSVTEKLEEIYQQFNLHRPADYHSPSLSVSDIVAIKQDGMVSCHYVDSIGFEKVSGFLPENPLKTAEMMVEDDLGMIDGIINNGAKVPTVKELEQQAHSGQPISLMDLAEAVHREEKHKKMSLMERLKGSPKQEHKKSSRKKRTEREI